MARMRNVLIVLAMVALLGSAAGCEWNAMSGFSRTAPQAPSAPEDPAAPEPAAEPPAKPGAVEAGPTTELAAAPAVAALQQDIERFVNRFPDSDLARKVNAPQAPAEDVATTAPAAVPAAAEPGRPEPATAHPDLTITPVPTVAAAPPFETNATADHDAPAQAEAARSTHQNSPAAPPIAEASSEPSPIRANAPLTADRVVRAASFGGAVPEPEAPKIDALEIEPVDSPTAPEPVEVKAESNRATVTDDSATGQSVQAAIEVLEKAVAERPNDFNALFRLRMLYLAEGFEDKATAPVTGLAPEAGQLFAEMTHTLVAVRDAVRDPFGRGEQAIDKAGQLLATLNRQAPVTIDSARLVSRVNSFGDYTEVAQPTFAAGQLTRVILYVEIGNFRSEKDKDGQFRTLLGETVELYDANGQSVWRQAHDQIPDLCRRARRDFFLAVEVALPATLPAGTYSLKVTVEDKLSATADQAQLPITLTAGNALP